MAHILKQLRVSIESMRYTMKRPTMLGNGQMIDGFRRAQREWAKFQN